jgi:hypothetical protein
LGLQKYFIFVIHQILQGFFYTILSQPFLADFFNFCAAKKMMFFECASQNFGNWRFVNIEIVLQVVCSRFLQYFDSLLIIEFLYRTLNLFRIQLPLMLITFSASTTCKKEETFSMPYYLRRNCTNQFNVDLLSHSLTIFHSA